MSLSCPQIFVRYLCLQSAVGKILSAVTVVTGKEENNVGSLKVRENLRLLHLFKDSIVQEGTYVLLQFVFPKQFPRVLGG